MATEIPHRPILQLADANSVFPQWFSKEWTARGLENVIVTNARRDLARPHTAPNIVYGADHESAFYRTVQRRLLSPLVCRLQGRTPLYRERFFESTGMPRELWQDYFDQFAHSVVAAWGLSRACAHLKPRFVLAHEASTYGIAAGLVTGVPRILFPWGGDVFTYVETSPYMERLVRFALRRAHLVIPSSEFGARHISSRFGVSPRKVIGISPGVVLEECRRLLGTQRDEARARYGIPLTAHVILNVRRFRPPWGSREVLNGFIEVARERPDCHFVLIGGEGSETEMKAAAFRLASSGFTERFSLFEGQVPLGRVLDLMGLCDLAVSLSPRSDMRSASVLQACASEAVPVILENPEWSLLAQRGLKYFRISERASEAVAAGIRDALAYEARWDAYRSSNKQYVTRNEDRSVQWERITNLIDETYSKWARHHSPH